MSYHINTNRKTSEPKDIKTGFNSNIFLNVLKSKSQNLKKKEILTKEIYKNKNIATKILFISTWGIKCGIATYTSHLLNNINKYYGAEITEVFPINEHKNICKIENDILHIQHEHGIAKYNFETYSKVIITFHTVHKKPKNMLVGLESRFNIVGYIAHSEEIKKVLVENTNKNVYLIPHGSEIIKLPFESKLQIRKELNFEKLGINDTDKCAFSFGFQSANKEYNTLIEACKNTGVKLIINGAKHECGYVNNIFTHNKKNVIFLDKFLTDMEIDMYSSACDLIIFNYISEPHYSYSGAMHRVIGSGNPLICNRVNHFNDIIENEHCLKFSDQKELELKIKEALEKSDEFGKKSLDYANLTSWETVSKMHLDVYRKYANIDDKIIAK